ncbi:hypothetical protein EUGRSUZ_F01988 [Eucalyptus grandis]|uniref:Uncharacterized protein n=2 Tax=Eucalyptus grandis TaxID=71139 RepID=A0A059BR09_EUCGR|nr:hypothetical protein EUGRSUZ_F01988 [Eucalyptus grandis]
MIEIIISLIFIYKSFLYLVHFLYIITLTFELIYFISSTFTELSEFFDYFKDIELLEFFDIIHSIKIWSTRPPWTRGLSQGSRHKYQGLGTDQRGL